MAKTVSIGDVETNIAKWGMWARRHTERLGLPTSSSICRMVEQAQVFERKQRQPKRALAKARKSGDARLIAEALGNAEHQLTARGNQTKVVTALKIGYVEPSIMAIDRIVGNLPGKYKKAIYRRYVYLQPDRIAARQLRVPREEYTGWVDAAVDFIAEKLEFDSR